MKHAYVWTYYDVSQIALQNHSSVCPVRLIFPPAVDGLHNSETPSPSSVTSLCFAIHDVPWSKMSEKLCDFWFTQTWQIVADVQHVRTCGSREVNPFATERESKSWFISDPPWQFQLYLFATITWEFIIYTISSAVTSLYKSPYFWYDLLSRKSVSSSCSMTFIV